jgi:hypothetical protein
LNAFSMIFSAVRHSDTYRFNTYIDKVRFWGPSAYISCGHTG